MAEAGIRGKLVKADEKEHLEKVKKTLSFLAKELNLRKVNWLLGASGALMVHGVEIIPHDLDIFVGKEDVEKLVNEFSEYVINPLHNYPENDKNFLEFQMKINKIEVEICELDINKTRPIFMGFNGQKIPVNPLEEELEFYKKREDKEKVVELIERKLLDLSPK